MHQMHHKDNKAAVHEQYTVWIIGADHQ